MSPDENVKSVYNKEFQRRLRVSANTGRDTPPPTPMSTEEKVARILDPSAWSAYDRLVGWEERTGNVMPVDGLSIVVSSSLSQSRRILSALEDDLT